MRLVCAVLALSITMFGCTPWRAQYLQDSTGHATQDEVASRLGPPAGERLSSTGEAVWLYRYTGAAVGEHGGSSWCTEYILTFTPQKILKRWNKQKC